MRKSQSPHSTSTAHSRGTTRSFLRARRGMAPPHRARPRRARIALTGNGHEDRDAAKERLLVHLLAGRRYEDVEALGEDLRSRARHAGDPAGDARARRPARSQARSRHRLRRRSICTCARWRDCSASTNCCTSLEVDGHAPCTGRMLEATVVAGQSDVPARIPRRGTGRACGRTATVPETPRCWRWPITRSAPRRGHVRST